MQRLLIPASLTALLFSGAIFGFFYAWICSTMWGLDTLDPRIAIPAMQAMNDSVRNAVFAPAFFGTPLVCALAAAVAFGTGNTAATYAFAAAALVYGLGGMVLTMAINVPMNRALGALEVPQDLAEAQAIWQAYSPRWQVFNTLRTVASGVALLLAGYGLVANVPRPSPTQGLP
ncbi:DUF1772 domain-containing protein [Antarctobacter sp.]|uniref:anthrone oxygenase family protein n=1 Tax=Antarctobacter sp. TaxID=1872577 RepID=UPI002B274CC3|nr:anthrone oxygenase family protein [Antarctobacter sp.]